MSLNNFTMPAKFGAAALRLDEHRDDVREGLSGLGPGRPPLLIGPAASSPVSTVPCFRCGAPADVTGGTVTTPLGDVDRGVPLTVPGQPCSGNGRHRQLASAWKGRSLRIALVGQIGTGKTTYLTALYDALVVNGALDPFGWNVVMPAEWRDVFEAALYRPMFVERRMIAKTRADRPSLWEAPDLTRVYEPFLAFTLVNRHDPALTVDITVVDVAAERLERDMDRTARHVGVSDAAIFFLNPSALSFAGQVIGSCAIGAPDQPGSGRNSTTATHSDVREPDWVQAARGERADTVPYPVCVALGKADMLTGYVDEYLLSQPTYAHNGQRGRATYADLLFDSFLAQDVLEFAGAGAYMRKVEDRFETRAGHQGVTYHLLAAAGADPVPNPSGVMEYPRLAPFRVVDPLLSLLYRKGFMPLEDILGSSTERRTSRSASTREVPANEQSRDSSGRRPGGEDAPGYDPGVKPRRFFGIF